MSNRIFFKCPISDIRHICELKAHVASSKPISSCKWQVLTFFIKQRNVINNGFIWATNCVLEKESEWLNSIIVRTVLTMTEVLHARKANWRDKRQADMRSGNEPDPLDDKLMHFSCLSSINIVSCICLKREISLVCHCCQFISSCLISTNARIINRFSAPLPCAEQSILIDCCHPPLCMLSPIELV